MANKTPKYFEFDTELIRNVENIATTERRSLTQQVSMFLEQGVEKWNERQDRIREYDRDYEKDEGKNE